MRAYRKWVICDPIDEPATLRSGLQLSSSDMEDMRYQRARIIAPPGDLVVGIVEGDHIYYDKVRAFEMMMDGRRVTLVNSDDIVSVI